MASVLQAIAFFGLCKGPEGVTDHFMTVKKVEETFWF